MLDVPDSYDHDDSYCDVPNGKGFINDSDDDDRHGHDDDDDLYKDNVEKRVSHAVMMFNIQVLLLIV